MSNVTLKPDRPNDQTHLHSLHLDAPPPSSGWPCRYHQLGRLRQLEKDKGLEVLRSLIFFCSAVSK